MALTTARANSDASAFDAIMDSLSFEDRRVAIEHLCGFIVGLLLQYGDPARVLAALGPRLEAQRRDG